MVHNTPQVVIEQIESTLPAVEIRSLRFLGAGDFACAWLVNKQLVVRFARHAEAEAALRREAEVLPRIAPFISTPIPRPEFHEASSPAGLGLVTYPLLRGKALTRRRFLSMTDSGRNHCAASVAQFLRELHIVPLSCAKCIPVFNPLEYYAELHTKAEAALFAHLPPILTAFLRELFHRYTEEAVHFPSHQVLLHGDFGPDHILSSIRHFPMLTGIIDFGDMRIGPPAWDIVFLYEDLGIEFMRAFLPHFTDNPEPLLRETDWFYQLDMIAWAVRETEKKGASGAHETLAALERLRRRSKNALHLL